MGGASGCQSKGGWSQWLSIKGWVEPVVVNQRVGGASGCQSKGGWSQWLSIKGWVEPVVVNQRVGGTSGCQSKPAHHILARGFGCHLNCGWRFKIPIDLWEGLLISLEQELSAVDEIGGGTLVCQSNCELSVEQTVE